MIQSIQIAVLLLIVVAAVAVAARRIGVPPAILLVIVGVALALVPGLPRVELAPELVLLLVLPPLIYAAGVAMSWREFRFNLRPITLLAVGCVVFTTVAVAAVAHALLGLPWPVAFVLGAIISPPDVVAPLAIARRLGLPRRLLVILEGEGLANDATALILYRFAVAAVSTGAFSLGPALGAFAAICVGEIAVRRRRRLADAAASPRGSRSARRDHAVAGDALSRLLGAGAPRRLGRARDRRNRPLHQLERAAADRVGHAAAGRLLLGPVHLSHRRHGLPAHGTPGANLDRSHRRAAGAGAAGSRPRSSSRS